MTCEDGSLMLLKTRLFNPAANLASAYFNKCVHATDFKLKFEEFHNKRFLQDKSDGDLDDSLRLSLSLSTLSEELGDRTLAAEENCNVETCFLREEEIPITLLIEPDNMLRVREISQDRLDDLVETLLDHEEKKLSSQLTVMMDGTRYIIIDGNHRFRAAKTIRDRAGASYFESFSCRVYSPLTAGQAIGLGFGRNQEAGDVYEMNDADTVACIRKVAKMEDNDMKEEDLFATIYQLLGVKNVSYQLIHYRIRGNHRLHIV